MIGLTGSIGMGKSTTAAMFESEGVPVWDADAAVHRLYGPGGAAVVAVGQLCPGAAGPDGVDRRVLREWLSATPDGLARLEAAVHPLVASDRAEFLRAAAARGEDVIVLDIPLLFETGMDSQCDTTVVVTASPEVQRDRVLARPGMSADSFDSLLARQMPDVAKRARADAVIETHTMAAARDAVRALLGRIRARNQEADDA